MTLPPAQWLLPEFRMYASSVLRASALISASGLKRSSRFHFFPGCRITRTLGCLQRALHSIICLARISMLLQALRQRHPHVQQQPVEKIRQQCRCAIWQRRDLAVHVSQLAHGLCCNMGMCARAARPPIGSRQQHSLQAADLNDSRGTRSRPHTTLVQ
eukprot:364721-Chlamydomonas_euryale.AAC.9